MGLLNFAEMVHKFWKVLKQASHANTDPCTDVHFMNFPQYISNLFVSTTTFQMINRTWWIGVILRCMQLKSTIKMWWLAGVCACAVAKQPCEHWSLLAWMDDESLLQMHNCSMRTHILNRLSYCCDDGSQDKTLCMFSVARKLWACDAHAC